MTEIPETVSFIGTSLVYSENNIAESCVNVDNCDCFCRIRFPVAYFHHYALFFVCLVYFCFSLVYSGLFLKFV